MTTATVILWGTPIGYVSQHENEIFGRFEFDPAFCQSGIELAPLHMPAIAGKVYSFPELKHRSFYGLPGLLADALPDKYGNQLINMWLASQGRTPESFNAVDRLCYTGKRAMGALEFEPGSAQEKRQDRALDVERLVELASMAFLSKENLDARLSGGEDSDAIKDILTVGSSAGGARAKAVIAFNESTGEVRSGQTDLREGFEHWLIKFDGVELSGDWDTVDPKGYGTLEYTYYLMAKQCGIDMMESKLFDEGGRHHFMTKRYDRDNQGGKAFVQSWAALCHYDYYNSGMYSYEQLLLTMKQLGMGMDQIEQQYRRVVFNVVGCNQDDHVKNFGFMMDRKGQWSLTPAYDLCHAEGSDFTRNHQLSIGGQTNGFDRQSLKDLAKFAGLPRSREKTIISEVVEAFAGWEAAAVDYGVPDRLRGHVLRTLRLNV